jgi:Flp pilus assembly protein TadG
MTYKVVVGVVGRIWRDALSDCSGSPAVEFALISPMLLLLLFGICNAGVIINNYMELTDSVRVGSRQLALGRSNTTPWSTAKSAITSSGANLTASQLTITTLVNGAACASDAACVTALSAAAGQPASVTATYPCSYLLSNITVNGVNLAQSCTLTSTSTERVE